MNQKFEGWKLALVLLIPLAIIGAAVWIGLAALGDDDPEELATADTELDAESLTTPTALPETAPVDAEPTEPPAPTAVPIPSAAPIQAPTAGPSAGPSATVAPAPTSRPAPVATTPAGPAPTSGPAPTATPDPSILTVTCTVDGAPWPDEVRAEPGQGVGPFIAVVSPPEAAANMTFVWSLAPGRIQTAARTGLVAYDELGLYRISLTAKGAPTGADIVVACGNVRIVRDAGDDGDDGVGGTLNVSCSVAPTDSTIQFAQANVGDSMTVTVRWTPKDTKLTLQYHLDLERGVPIEFVENAESPKSKAYSWPEEDAEFVIIWVLDANTRGRVACSAYPSAVAAAPTLVPTSTPGPTSTSTP